VTFKIVGDQSHPAIARAVAITIPSAANRAAEGSHRAAEMLATVLLAPAAVITFAFGLWRLGADLGWTGNFIFGEGLFSHWIIWMALSLGLKSVASMATRNGTKL
jgi:hypothetical protein